MWRRIGDATVKEIRDWENAPMYEMTRLKANTFYKVEVRAHNDIGFSLDATMLFQTAAGISKYQSLIPSVLYFSHLFLYFLNEIFLFCTITNFFFTCTFTNLSAMI